MQLLKEDWSILRSNNKTQQGHTDERKNKEAVSDEEGILTTSNVNRIKQACND